VGDDRRERKPRTMQTLHCCHFTGGSLSALSPPRVLQPLQGKDGLVASPTNLLDEGLARFMRLGTRHHSPAGRDRHIQIIKQGHRLGQQN
jgi:hypothetical protein